MEGFENNTPPAPVPSPAPASPAPPIPEPAQPAPPPAPAYDAGGNVQQQSWIKSVDWLQVGLVFFGVLGIMTVIQYHRLKIKNLKSEIPDVKKRLDEIDIQLSDLSANKVDKNKPQKNNLGLL